MPGVVLLIVALVVNYVRHKAGHRTICQCIRRTLPRPLAALGLAGFFLRGSSLTSWRGTTTTQRASPMRVSSSRQFALPEPPVAARASTAMYPEVITVVKSRGM